MEQLLYIGWIKMIEQTPEEVAQAMFEEPEVWAKLYLDTKEELEDVTSKYFKLIEYLYEITDRREALDD